MNHVQKHPTILATKDQLFKTNLGNVEVLQIISQTKLLLTQKYFSVSDWLNAIGEFLISLSR